VSIFILSQEQEVEQAGDTDKDQHQTCRKLLFLLLVIGRGNVVIVIVISGSNSVCAGGLCGFFLAFQFHDKTGLGIDGFTTFFAEDRAIIVPVTAVGGI